MLDSISYNHRRLMLPDADHLPATRRQRVIDSAITGDIAFQLGAPVGAVGAGNVAVRWAAVPEAPVYENGKVDAGEDDVGTHEPTGYANGEVDPKAQPAPMQLTTKC